MDALKAATKRCPTCGDEVADKPIGRPLIFCSVACRRAMAAMRRELVQLGEAITEGSSVFLRHEIGLTDWLKKNAYRKFGFEMEGTHKRFALRAGEYTDAHVMARLKRP